MPDREVRIDLTLRPKGSGAKKTQRDLRDVSRAAQNTTRDTSAAVQRASGDFDDLFAKINRSKKEAAEVAQRIDTGGAGFEKTKQSIDATDKSVTRLTGNFGRMATAGVGVAGSIQVANRAAGAFFTTLERAAQLGVDGADAFLPAVNAVNQYSDALKGAAAGGLAFGPVGAVAGGALGLISSAARETTEELELLEQTNKRVEEAQRLLARTQREYADEVKRNGLARFYGDQADAIRDFLEAADAAREVAAATRSADNAEARLQLSRQPQNANTRAQGLQLDVRNQLAELVSNFQAIQDMVTKLRDEADNLQNEVRRSTQELGEDDKNTQEAVRNLNRTNEELRKAQLELDTQAQVLPQKLKELGFNFESQFDPLRSQLEKELAAEVQPLANRLSLVKNELNQLGQQGVADIENVLADGRLTQEELGKLRQGLQNVFGNLDTTNQELLKAVNKALQSIGVQSNSIKTLNGLISQIQAQVQSVQSQVQALQFSR